MGNVGVKLLRHNCEAISKFFRVFTLPPLPADVASQRNFSWRSWWQMKMEQLKKLITKKKMEQVKKPVLLCGCEAWTLTDDLKRRLDSFGTSSLRRIYKGKKKAELYKSRFTWKTCVNAVRWPDIRLGSISSSENEKRPKHTHHKSQSYCACASVFTL